MFAAFSVWVLALDLWQVVVHGRVWTGTDGVYLVDQLQYLAWVRDAARHALVSNLFVLHATPADYFQPAIAISGALAALGVAPWLALLVWKPVAVLTFFWVARRFVAVGLEGLWARRAALLLALFFGSYTVVYGSVGALGDLMPGFLSWGYVFALLAVAALAAALLAYDDADRGGRRIWLPGLLGGLAGLIHPWHGEVLILTVLGAELARRRPAGPQAARGLALPALTLAGAGLPLVYYAVLGRADLSWRLARVASKHAFPLWAIGLALAPLLICALPAYRERVAGFLPAAARAWPVAALAVYAVSATALGATPLHAFEGVTLPLAVLAVQGARRLSVPRPRLLAVVALAAFTVPAGVWQLSSARDLVAPRPGTARFIARDEQRALDYLASQPRPGGVVSRSYLGALVPAATGRHTLVGDCLWSEPGCSGRLVTVRRLFEGRLSAGATRRLLTRADTRFLLADCRPGPDLARRLGALVSSVRRFGCARVYLLRG